MFYPVRCSDGTLLTQIASSHPPHLVTSSFEPSELPLTLKVSITAFLGGVIGGVIGCVGMAAFLYIRLNEARTVRARMEEFQQDLEHFNMSNRYCVEALDDPDLPETPPGQATLPRQTTRQRQPLAEIMWTRQ
ncbi:hypothetical protein ABW21_db0201137 [Orbilia brochopaga]|nr:hypothetical protein ABW21_db0201137 [Drechslerella brochopaga]